MSRFGDKGVWNGLDREDTMMVLMGLGETSSMMQQSYPFPVFTEYFADEEQPPGTVTLNCTTDEDLKDNMTVSDLTPFETQMIELYLRENDPRSLTHIKDMERTMMQAAVRFGDVVFENFQTPIIPFAPIDPLASAKTLRAKVSIMIWPQLELAKLNQIRDKGVPNKHVHNQADQGSSVSLKRIPVSCWSLGNVHLSTVFIPKVEQIIRTVTKDSPKKPIIIFGTILYPPVMDIPETFIR